MCGRYTLFKLNQLLLRFPWITHVVPTTEARSNIAPTQPILVNTNRSPDQLQFVRWGLVPSWAKDITIGNKMFNARAETLADRSAYKTPLKRRRCLIPADGFYEWKHDPDTGRKRPIHFHLKSAEPFAFAGLWDEWTAPDGSTLLSCTLITTTPNELVSPVHNRMPAMLRPEHARRWMAPGELSPTDVAQMLAPYPTAEMDATPVGPDHDLRRATTLKVTQQQQPTLFD